MTLRVIDLETTGTDPDVDEIVEIAAVDIRSDFSIHNERATLVNPMRSIPPEASAVHHIVDADVTRSPGIHDAIKPFLGADVYIAHNSRFEQGFLGRHLPRETPWICTYKCSLRVWPDAPGHSNQVLRYWRGHIEPFGWRRDKVAPHRALSDVVVTAAIMIDLLRAASWSELCAWSQQPALMPKLTFGKHRGVRYVDAPRDYLEWILSTDFDEDVKFSARHWLARQSEGVVA